jgi:hypothetical protein
MAFIRIEADAVLLNGQAAGTYGPYRLSGGEYGFEVVGTGTAQLLKSPGPDGVTNVAIAAPVTAPGYATYFVPPGSYVVTIATGPASVAVSRIKLG